MNKEKLAPGDLVVKFEGRMIVKKADRPDDRGSLSHWLLNEMVDACNDEESTDATFDRLDLGLTLGEVTMNKEIRWEDE